MLIRVTAVEVCDARDDDSSNGAGYHCKIPYKIKLLFPEGPIEILFMQYELFVEDKRCEEGSLCLLLVLGSRRVPDLIHFIGFGHSDSSKGSFSGFVWTSDGFYVGLDLAVSFCVGLFVGLDSNS